ncbi:MAG: aspartate--tRNA ligase [Chloroflexi bacterium]|nr:MAG: aspartate--tRNA ligase [Chloroflexota bacterium]
MTDAAKLTTGLRSDVCGALRPSDVGRRVRLAGWIHRRRDHGSLVFIDLRDRYGIVQVVVDAAVAPEAHAALTDARSEWVIAVEGTVAARRAGTENEKLATGGIEVAGESVTVLSQAKTPPFYINDTDAPVDESLRLKYRYLDLRREPLRDRILLRSAMVQAIREVHHEHGFVEVETPILIKSTPEGARDFIVPSRLQQGSVYALPQSPQQMKQLLMVAGFDRYFQIARCFRDEDLRGDRQPEFTQLDIEMSFVDEASVRAYVEAMVIEVTKRIRPDRPIQQLPLPTFTYEEAMERYGSDKPDIRFAMELIDLGAALPESTGFKVFDETRASGGRIRAIRVAGRGGITRSDVDDLTERAKRYGANGLVWIALQPDGEVRSPIAKFLSPEATAALWSATGGKATHADGDLLLIVAGPKILSAEVLGRLRVEVALELGLADPDVLAFCWVHRFPMYQWEAESGRWDATHNPFSAPVPEHLNLLTTTSGDLAKRSEGDPAAGALAQQYDIVLNGWELGGGSIRIHDRALLERSFALMGHSLDDARAKFGALLDAFEYGAPPHGGIAIGVERWAALLAGQINIREVMAFPKTQSGSDLMLEAPSEPDAKQWAELGLSVRPVKS